MLSLLPSTIYDDDGYVKITYVTSILKRIEVRITDESLIFVIRFHCAGNIKHLMPIKLTAGLIED